MNNYAAEYEAALRKALNGLNKNDPAYPCKLQKAITAALLKTLPTQKSPMEPVRTAYYFSAEYLPGKICEQSLAALDLNEITEAVLAEFQTSLGVLNSLPDPALGNGGLGRLASCILEAGAYCNLPLKGYGLHYRYGLFKQAVKEHKQKELPDPWQNGCQMEICRKEHAQEVCFGNRKVLAVPFDIPIISKKRVNTLRLWACEATHPVDFEAFCDGEYEKAFKNTVEAQALTAFLYPEDSKTPGKELRLKQEYFLTCASLGDILNTYKKTAQPIENLADWVQIQLNDTHPAMAILELLRRLCEDYKCKFSAALQLCKNIFNYTNHTVMAEALECWSCELFSRVLPQIYPYAVMVNNALLAEITVEKVAEKTAILQNGCLHMANLCLYVSKKVNGVAELHTNLLKENVFLPWQRLYPQKICNITNGISHRRWLNLANPALKRYIDSRIGTEWQENFSVLAELHKFTSPQDLEELRAVKQQNKARFCRYLKEQHGLQVSEKRLFTVQIKRIHEYKRQLMNLLSILSFYIDYKNGELENYYPTTFIFAGKAAPGYIIAKDIIRLINATSDFLKQDSAASELFQIVFIPDYNVKNAMQIIPAADLSEQISMATTEASGTGNMKLALNGAPTVGTLDGANIEIVRHAGEENNYIFGANATQIMQTQDRYNPFDIFETNPKIRQVLTFLQENSPLGDFSLLYNTLLSCETADKYRILTDLPSYSKVRQKANSDFQNKPLFAEKCLHNIAGAATFSADRTVQEYNRLIWQL